MSVALIWLYKVVSYSPGKHGISFIQRGHAVPSARNILYHDMHIYIPLICL